MPSRGDAIFIALSAVYGAGMVLFLSSKFNSGVRKFGPHKNLAILGAFGAGAVLLGAINLVMVHRSKQDSSTGQIVNLREYHWKHAHSTFYVTKADGSLLHVTCDYAGERLVPGETVHVDVLEYQSTLLRLAVLDGQYAGWTLTEGDGTVGSEVTISSGLAAALTAWMRRRRESQT
jgi:hypothetical protein